MFFNACTTRWRKITTSVPCFHSRFFTGHSILIVGGGTSGIAALKELKQEGYNPKLFESSNDIGGQWNLDNKLSAIYPSMRSNTSQNVWFYSDFPLILSDNQPRYQTPTQTQNHMKSYCKHFNLYPNIHFNTNVNQIRFNNNTNQWNVNYSTSCVDTNNEDNSKNNQESFDKIVICSGLYKYPKMPQNLDITKFNGKIYHTSEIGKKSIDQIKCEFNDKNIAIIGSGTSGIDMAENICNLTNDNSKIYFLYRQQFSLLPCYYKNICVESQVLFHRNPPLNIFDICIQYDSLDKYGIYLLELTDEIKAQATDPINPQIPRILPSRSFGYHCSETRKISGIYGNVIDLNDNSIIYEPKSIENRQSGNIKINANKSTLDNIDIIICATGFESDEKVFPYFDESFVKLFYDKNIKSLRRLLYMNTIVSEPEYENNIAFIGANQVQAQWCFELQARFIAALWTGRINLPSIEDQKKWIDDNLVKYDPIPWFPGPVVQPFADDIAQYIGVLPTESDFPNKEMYQRVQNERMFPTQYRIKGYGKIDNAIDILCKQMSCAATETLENQSLVTGVEIENLDKVYKY